MTIRMRIIASILAAATASSAPVAFPRVSCAQGTPTSTAIDPAATAPRPGQAPQLSPEQKTMIFRLVRQDHTKTARREFPAQVGADVPPSIELYNLPDEAVIQAPITKMYRVVVTGGNVVLVDPTTMRVVDVIDR